MNYEEMARIAYANDPKLKKALAAGIAMDNAMKLDRSKGGATNCHFMMDNFLKYFSYEALGERNILLNKSI